MQLLSSSPVIYGGFSDEALPDPRGLSDGAMFIILDTPHQVWIVRNSAWTFKELAPLNVSINIPVGGAADVASIAAPSSGAASSSTVTRPVVVIGSNVSGEIMSGIERVLERVLDISQLMLKEQRIISLLLHQGLGFLPIEDDLDSLRESVLTAEETITR